MPRGQYDRAAARAKREAPPHGAGNRLLTQAEVLTEIAAPLAAAWNEDARAFRLQAQLDAANERIAKLEKLCRTHGLLV